MFNKLSAVVPKQLSFFPTEAVISELHKTHKNEILYKEEFHFGWQPKQFSLWLAIETIFKQLCFTVRE